MSNQKKQAPRSRSQSDRKGRLVEEIAAKLHASPGVEVEKRVKLPPVHGAGGPQEIDILVTTRAAGYPVRWAIECKNEREPIEAEQIGAFRTKLEYLGFSARDGIFISASPYRSGAKELAAYYGIRLLHVTGLSDDRLSAAVVEIFQSVVYLLLRVRSTVMAYGRTLDAPRLNGFLFNEAGECVGTFLDVIWQHWCVGRLPSSIGTHRFDVQPLVPSHQIIDGEKVPLLSFSPEVQVVGLVLNVQGEAIQHTLVNASNNVVERARIEARFDSGAASVSLATIFTEEELETHLKQSGPEAARLVIGRILLPRIETTYGQWDLYWPPSDRALKEFRKFSEWYKENPDAPGPDRRQIEGAAINTVWEPISEQYMSGGVAHAASVLKPRL